mmetsp:Transcript_21728/g.30222  ORF Transcript_21728/g.30222 Transcript_21728/m.30222 type:complete len:168 (+) Transcript_21728:239-742(+)
MAPSLGGPGEHDLFAQGKLLFWIGRHMENEFKMRCAQIKRIMGSGLIFWAASLFCQEWTGREEDVTVVCPSSWGDISRCIYNPTPEDYKQFLQAGEKAIWPVLATMRCHLRVELELAESATKLQQRSRSQGNLGLKALAQRGSSDRIPSWNTLMRIARGDSGENFDD